MNDVTIPAAIYVAIIEGDRLIEIRPTSMEELAAWVDRRQRDGTGDGTHHGTAEEIVGMETS